MSQAGDLMGGRYRLTHRIAAGGMGEVWQASDEILGRNVAVKLLKEGLTDEKGFTERFRNEARLSAALAHGNIAQVYDYGEEGSLAYLVMEFVPGKPLSTILHERGPISAADTANLMGQAAAALQAAHRAGLIHRDVKPANMLVTHDGVVKLTDFGIARAVGSAAMTRTGEVMGTAQYLAPEAAMGRETTALTDVYSLAVVTYEMLGGRRPFTADSAVALALAHVNEEPPPLPTEVPAPMRAVVHAGLRKDPAQRPSSAQEFGRALRQAVTDSEQMGLNVWATPPRPSPNGGFTAPSGPQPGSPSGLQPGPAAGPRSGGQAQTPSTQQPKSRAQRKAHSAPAPAVATSGSQAVAATGGSKRALWLILGGVAVLVVIAVVVGVILARDGGSGAKVPTAPNTGPFSNNLTTYSPEGNS
ncbi:protein kinase domain-containing protein [Flexivirga caeni]|uniref:non-specific serine/threonine protein kinase n=1 Tax=Flexivirga caeni TaxID=2294115 RepID=A0A3M9M422_9MICO|nr:protein kinase [Flexivirga caeni]RNI19683.1 serine/threonine protein kinase [Flexivirga caeni]